MRLTQIIGITKFRRPWRTHQTGTPKKPASTQLIPLFSLFVFSIILEGYLLSALSLLEC